jgi:pyridoxine/pyridoxamine 5'-phosphate oxidase
MMDVTKKDEFYAFLRQHRYGVISTVTPDGAPEAALVGVATMPDLSLIFETIETTRKFANLRRNPRVAMVIGWGGERTLQYEGVADARDDDDLSDSYYAVLPESRGHAGWPGLTYVRIRPRWIRLSSYGPAWNVEEFRFGH